MSLEHLIVNWLLREGDNRMLFPVFDLRGHYNQYLELPQDEVVVKAIYNFRQSATHFTGNNYTHQLHPS